MARCARIIFVLFALPVAACAESSEARRAAAIESMHGWESSGLRPVRVLIVDGARTVRVRSDGPVYLVNEDGVRVDALGADDWHHLEAKSPSRLQVNERGRPSGFQLETGAGHTLTLARRVRGTWSDTRAYYGRFELRAKSDGLNIINHVDIEHYVAGVVAYEVWPTFQTETYRAQAIVARTYALYEMMQRQQREYDVRATQNSQVYRGVREDVVGRRAVEAARYTRGLVLSYVHDGVEELFCTYYSAACGGVSQSAAIFGEAGDLEPLSGGVQCDYCAIAPGDAYRWGAVRLKLKDVRERLIRRYPGLRALGGLRKIEVAERTASGRPLNLRLHGAKGKTELILTERFRLAVGASKLKSSDFAIECAKGEVTFKNGRGYGHGLGLCQWGAEGQARQGRRAGEILLYYFPGAKIDKAFE